jgi:hypothetical protein
LAGFEGILQVDGYSGFKSLLAGRPPDRIKLAFCWAIHGPPPRRKGDLGVSGDRGRVQPSIRPRVAARHPGRGP